MTTPLLRRCGFTLFVLGSMGLVQFAGASAQTDQPVLGYSIAIYQGSCDAPAVEPSFLLGATFPYGMNADDPELDLRGTGTVQPVPTLEETIDTTFETLLDEQPHMIAVHEGEAVPEGIVACGELGGIVDEGRLTVGVRPVNDADVAGIAILDEDESGFLGLGDSEVNVRVYVLDGPAIAESDEPEVTPTNQADVPVELTPAGDDETPETDG